jgi:hypothetical protein
MKNMQIFNFRGVTFQYVAGCGIAILEEDGSHAEIESMEERNIRKEAESILETECDFSNSLISIAIDADFILFGDEENPDYILYEGKLRHLTYVCGDASSSFADGSGDDWDLFWEIEGTDVQLMYVCKESTYYDGYYFDKEKKDIFESNEIETRWQ